MEDCGYCSLSTFIKSGNYVTEEQLREIASSCLLGLNYLHSRGIMHGVIVLY